MDLGNSTNLKPTKRPDHNRYVPIFPSSPPNLKNASTTQTHTQVPNSLSFPPKKIQTSANRPNFAKQASSRPPSPYPSTPTQKESSSPRPNSTTASDSTNPANPPRPGTITVERSRKLFFIVGPASEVRLLLDWLAELAGGKASRLGI